MFHFYTPLKSQKTRGKKWNIGLKRAKGRTEYTYPWLKYQLFDTKADLSWTSLTNYLKKKSIFKNQTYDYINANDTKAIIYVYKWIQSSKFSVYFIFEFLVKWIQIHLFIIFFHKTNNI